MGIRINTNVMAINALRNLRLSSARVSKSMERLSSGLRINRAADDAAGLAISENMRRRLGTLRGNRRNAEDGLSVAAIAEGSMNEISNIVIRMQELATQAASETIGETERGHLQQEFAALRDEIDRIVAVTEFNGIRPLDGSGGSLDIHVGPDSGPNSSIQLDLTGGLDATALGLDGLSIDGADNGAALAAITALEGATTAVNGLRAGFGATQNRLESTIRSIDNTIENLSAAMSRIRDVDVAIEMSNLVSAQILQQAGISVLAQAMNQPSLALRLLG